MRRPAVRTHPLSFSKRPMVELRGPGSSEIEVSIFGRGYGEAILFHVGDGRWVLVDSLLDADGAPAPLKYLAEIGVAPASALSLIVATHWHDDHVGGIAAAYGVAPNATLAVPLAMSRTEVAAFLANARNGGSERLSSGVKELDDLAITRHEQRRQPIRLAKANNVLLRYDKLTHGQVVAVEAISPCDADVEAFVAFLAGTPRPSQGQRLMPFDRNDVSVALWVSIGEHRVLLGADLESTAETERGWHAVLASPARPSGGAAMIKIPHHGSSNAHHQPLWDEMLTREPLAALTTWNRGRKLPQVTDVERILALTPHAYATSRIDRKPGARPAAVLKTLAEANARVRATQPQAGHVRLRLDLTVPGAGWRVDLFNDALSLRDFAA